MIIAPGAISPFNRNVSVSVSSWETGNALVFDGIDDNVSLASEISLTGDFTIAWWVFYTAGSFTCMFSADAEVTQIRFFSASTIRININGTARDYTDDTVRVTGWHQYMATRTGSRVILYRNGVLTTPVTSDDFGATDTFKIKHLGTFQGTVIPLDGRLDDLYIYDTVIGTAQNSIDFYNTGTPVDPETVIPNATHAYRFNGSGTDTTLIDENGGNNGTLQFFPVSGMWVSRI